LMSRVSYVMMNPGGDKEMTTAVREAINSLAERVAQDGKIDLTDILDIVVVGNPVMHHLFLGLDPTELGGAPFALATGLPITRPAREVDLQLNPGAYLYVLPCIAGHVGADTAGVVLSENPHLSESVMLVVDVGTNAEIVLGSRHRLLACSSPTGPAFEGAQISAGQRAAPGAIERVRIDPLTLEPRFKVIGCELWSNEAGFEEFVAGTGVTGICGSGIIEAIAEMYLCGIINQDGLVDGAFSARSGRLRQTGRTYCYVLRSGEPFIAITQNDIRAIQLAKAALYAGTRLLMDKLGIDRVERIRLAGAFGSHIDVKYAMVLGLIPDCPLDKVQSAGNAAGTGARIALVNSQARDEIELVVRGIEKIETAVEPKFQHHFVEAMAIPHKTAPTPNLASVVALPPNKIIETTDASGGERRRRRR
ncbi:MAG TPA: ASKHA domain-containing protein, partial [Aestuariivirgaceae bacterium]